MGPSARIKRRRSDTANDDVAAVKRLKCDGDDGIKRPRAHIVHSVLSEYYPAVLTLREYVLSRLPSTSRLRRKKISRIGKGPGPLSETETRVSHLLDTTLIGAPEKSKNQSDERRKEWVSFSQQKNEDSNVTLSDASSSAIFSQAEIVDFVIWLLFSRDKKGSARPTHLLCDGFRKSIGRIVQRQANADGNKPSIPGLFSVFPNHHVDTLKKAPWPQMLVLLGKAGERIMIDVLLDCAIFASVSAGTGNMLQLSGIPLSEMEPLDSLTPHAAESGAKARPGASGGESQAPRSPADISFARNRMFYARAALTARGNIQLGFRHIHIMNRAAPVHKDEAARTDICKDERNEENTLKVMAYIFPRQFGLHNVFTSDVDRTRTSQKLQDYTLREEELSSKFGRTEGGKPIIRIHLPKRLRGDAKRLVQRLQVLHARCSYASLFEHYCPSPLRPSKDGVTYAHSSRQTRTSLRSSSTQPGTASSRRAKRMTSNSRRLRQAASLDLTGKTIVDLATPVSHVSRFCQVALSKIIPNEFWGNGPDQEQNKELVLRSVDRFIRFRRFENMTLHETFQGIKISNIDWLAPASLRGAKMSQPDKEKRIEIFYEFLYYVFDSLLIPLIRCNFYVTDSSKHKNRLFYFRHDVWRCIAEPATAILKADLLETVKLKDALDILDSRKLGASHLRLLPKDTTLRPIMNLKRRELLRGNRKVLGQSINSILQPIHSVFTLESELNPSSLGSSMFSRGDIYTRLKAFRSKSLPLAGKKFYFAKVDVQSAFDTMPQEAVVRLMRDIPSELRYLVSKYVEIKPGESTLGRKPSKRWQSLATTPQDATTFGQRVEDKLGPRRRNTIFVNSGARWVVDTKGLVALLTSHLEQNLVKIGKKYYRQKRGVPQGSVLSTLFCNLFYADLERRHLSFLDEGPADDDDDDDDATLLLRLVDDFLLVTTSRSKAVRFVEVMHAGLPDYGVTVSPPKSLVNFDVRPAPSSPPLARCAGRSFPYCGIEIDTATLSISLDRATTTTTTAAAGRPRVADSLTVEASRRPGLNFTRKTLNAFLLQSHMMYYDTSHQSPAASLSNLREAFSETARKTCAYIRCLPAARRPGEALVVATLQRLVDTAFGLLTSRHRKVRSPGYECAVSRVQVGVLALGAFGEEMRARGAAYGGVVSWIEGEMRRLEGEKGLKRRAMALGRRNAEV